MPVRFVNDPEEWFRLTGERGSVYIESAPRKPKKRRAPARTEEQPNADEAPPSPTSPDS